MQRKRTKTQLEGWSRLRTPEVVMALVERFDQVELIEHIFSKAMFNALSTPALVSQERHDLIHKLWVLAFEQLATLEASDKARQARIHLDAYARACLSVLDNYEFFDPKATCLP